MPPERRALLTGFEAYGGRGDNPSALVAEALDGQVIGGLKVVGRVLPVALAGLAARLERLIARTRPSLVIATGQAPGEPVIRLERIGVNLADFELPDNRGRRVRDRPLVRGAPDALFATLPLRAIHARLVARGIPARLSETAGLYLCNAALFHLLLALKGKVPCGFVHLPSLPAQVARGGGGGRDDDRLPAPSMELGTMTEAVRLVLEVSAGTARPTRRGWRSGTGRSA
jgi:pyroglutamyl-peptidase